MKWISSGGFQQLSEKLYAWLAVMHWKMNKKAMIATVGRFQTVEADGVWHLMRLYRKMPDANSRRKIFSHMLEEDLHAELFSDFIKSESDGLVAKNYFKRSDLCAPSDPIWKPIAHVHVGEMQATSLFRNLKMTLPAGRLKATLSQIVEDEEGHVGLTESMAHGYLKPEELHQLDEYVEVVKQQRIYRGFNDLKLGFLNFVGIIILYLTYFLFGWLAFLSAKSRLRLKVVPFSTNKIKRFMS